MNIPRTSMHALMAALFAASISPCRAQESTATATAPAPAPPSIGKLIPWVLDHEASLKGIDFADVVQATTGRRIIPFRPDAPADAALLAVLVPALDDLLIRMSADSSPVRNLPRINEASRYFEDGLHAAINAHPDFECRIPPTAAGEAQRSGYPDLQILHRPTGTITYLDPKLFAAGSGASSLRAFYFEPKLETNKILADAHHLLVGIEHDGNDGHWKFLSWKLVDLAKLKVRLKAEFQASNHDIYSEEMILKSGGK